MQEQVRVAPVTPDTVPVVHALFQTIVAEAFPHLPPTAIASYREGWSREAIHDRAGDSGSVMLAAFDGADSATAPLGCASARGRKAVWRRSSGC